MKVLIFLAFVGAAVGARGPGGGPGGRPACDIEEADTMRSAGGVLVNYIMGDCRPNDAEFSVLLESESCVAVFNAGKCYYDGAVGHYGGVETVTYGELRTGVPHLQRLGNVLCANVEACYTPIKAAVLACHAADDGFKAAAIAKIENYYNTIGKPQLEAYVADSDNNAVVGTLVEIAMSRFSNVDDIIATFNSYTEGTDAVSDADNAATAIKDAASDFCTSGCTDKTANFIKGLFGHLDKARACPDAVTFCGGCAVKAAHFMQSRREIPCCLRAVVDGAISGSEMVTANYGDQIASIEAYVEEQFEGKEDLLQRLNDAKDFVLAQVVCLQAVYDGSPNSCPDILA